MTRLIHDRFAKDYLEEILSPSGVVNLSYEVSSETQLIDVYFTPHPTAPDYLEMLGILGKMAISPAIFEPFRNPVSIGEVCSCLSKSLDIRANLQRRARRENTRWHENAAPRLWILTPTASTALLDGFHATPDENQWLPGIYFLGEYLRMAIVVIHQLPTIPETLWLRLLGRGKVQQQAIAELTALPADRPGRANTLELLYQLQSSLATNQQPEVEDQELVMAIAPIFQQKLEAAEQKGRQEGRQEEQRSILENFLQMRFGKLAPQVVVALNDFSVVPPAEFGILLGQLSAIPTDEAGQEQALRAIAEIQVTGNREWGIAP
jgi:hypothetical protein